jgi:hypothetical protein
MACLAGCGTFSPREVAQPSGITVRDAVFEVATTLRDVQDLVPPEKRAGLLADEVTVVFNVAATSTTTSSANLNISNVILPNGTLEGGASSQNTSQGTRGNQITIKFKNIATSDMTKGALSLKQFQTGGGISPRNPSSPGGKSAVVEDKIRDICNAISDICVMNRGVIQIDNEKLRIQQQRPGQR